jgi:H/ACA ribonucleoprotein complex subunit 4
MRQKYGRPNEATPAKWHKDYKDFNAPLDNSTQTPVTKEIEVGNASKETESAIAPEAEATPGKSEETVPEAVRPEPGKLNDDNKKRKRHEGETPEEKAERKRKKKEKKEKRKSKKDESGDSE